MDIIHAGNEFALMSGIPCQRSLVLFISVYFINDCKRLITADTYDADSGIRHGCRDRRDRICFHISHNLIL